MIKGSANGNFCFEFHFCQRRKTRSLIFISRLVIFRKMSFNKELVANSCKTCLKYIFKNDQRLPITEDISEKLVEVLHLQVKKKID
jgi:hypothetical protein